MTLWLRRLAVCKGGRVMAIRRAMMDITTGSSVSAEIGMQKGPTSGVEIDAYSGSTAEASVLSIDLPP